MKYKEGPWYIPLFLMAAGLAAVVTIPRQTGAAVHSLLHGGSTALQAAFGAHDEQGNPEPISIRLPAVPGPPSAQDGPPSSWNN